ncbi:MAG: serine hydrolase domain-containing protein, partial [Myxococcota bacterium]
MNLDLGVLGSAWTRQLAIVGNENVDFRWRSSGFSVAKANWELRDGGNNLIAQGQPTSLLDADGYFRFSLDLAPLNVSPPLSISVQPQTAGGLIAAARSNDVELGDLPDVGGRCLTASEQGIPIGGKLESIRQSHSVPALAGAIITKDSFMMLDAVGIRGVYTGVPVTPFDRWHLGSITKSMTSTLAAVLMQKYPASLQPGTTVADAFSSRFWVGSLDPAFASLTLRDLMAHRAGIENVDPAAWTHMVDSSLSLIEQREQFTRAMGQTPPTNPAGSPFVYRNENFIIAGAMLEAIFGKSWEQLMEEHLFDPLEMNDFGFGTTVLDGNSQPMGHYNNQFGHLLPNQGDNTPSLGPAGTVHMSLADAARYLRLYLNGNEGELALTAATMSELLSPYGGMGQRYNWGWGNSADGFGQVRIGHDGSNGLWYESVLVFPGRGYALVAASNIFTVD